MIVISNLQVIACYNSNLNTYPHGTIKEIKVPGFANESDMGE